MNMLIVYSTNSGSTGAAAELIASTLKSNPTASDDLKKWTLGLI